MYNIPGAIGINTGSQYHTSPEQYYSAGKHIGKPTDVWALGCIISCVIDAYENGNGEGIIKPDGLGEYPEFLGTPNHNEFQFVESIINPELSI